MCEYPFDKCPHPSIESPTGYLSHPTIALLVWPLDYMIGLVILTHCVMLAYLCLSATLTPDMKSNQQFFTYSPHLTSMNFQDADLYMKLLFLAWPWQNLYMYSYISHVATDKATSLFDSPKGITLCEKILFHSDIYFRFAETFNFKLFGSAGWHW